MVDFLGPLGGLVPIPTASEITPARDSLYRLSVTVEGVGRAQLLPRPLPRRPIKPLLRQSAAKG